MAHNVRVLKDSRDRENRTMSWRRTVGMTACAYVLPRTTRRSYMMLPYMTYVRSLHHIHNSWTKSSASRKRSSTM